MLSECVLLEHKVAIPIQFLSSPVIIKLFGGCLEWRLWSVCVMDVVWIHICCPVEFVENVDGKWEWKYVGKGKKKTRAIMIHKNTSFVEFYDKVVQELEIDTTVKELEMQCIVPVMSNFPSAPPMVIDSDNSVKWLVSFCERTFVGISLIDKDNRNEETHACGNNCGDMAGENRGNDVFSSKAVSNEMMNKDTPISSGVKNVDNLEEDISDDLSLAIQFMNDDVGMEVGSDDIYKSVDPLLSSLGSDGAGDVSLEAFDRHNINVERLSNEETETHNVNGVEENDGVELSTPNQNSVPVILNVSDAGSIVPPARIPESEDMHEHDIFESKELFIQKLEMLAVRHHFEFTTVKSTRSIYVVACKDGQCKWRVRATRIGEGADKFEVRVYKKVHTCSLTVRNKDHNNASYTFIAMEYAARFTDPNRAYLPKDVINDFRREFGYTVSYTKAWMAKNFAVEMVVGKPADSYGQLPKYCHMLELRNPETVTEIFTDRKDEFKYLFICLGQTKKAFQSSLLRRVVVVDGTHLSSAYKGVLLTATCEDANSQIYPIAWGVVDSENNRSWSWFFEQLKSITGDTNELVIVSDRADSIKHGVKKVFRNAHHGYCIFHMRRNLNTKFPRFDIGRLFTSTAEAYTLHEFEALFNALCSKTGVEASKGKKKKTIRQYLDKESFCHWARAHFPGMRYNIMTSNSAESFNSVLLKARELCVLGMLERIREIMQDWFAKRHAEAMKCKTPLPPEMEKLMLEKYNASLGIEVKEIASPVYDVRDGVTCHIVDLGKSTCTCKQFQVHLFPCKHAIAAIKASGGHGYEHCSPHYTVECWRALYSEAVYPLPNKEEVAFPMDVIARKVLPPSGTKRQAGRPQKKRKKSAGEPR